MKSKKSFKNIYFLSGGAFTSPEPSLTSSHAGLSSYSSSSTGATSKHARGFGSLAGTSSASWDSTKSSGRKDATKSSSCLAEASAGSWVLSGGAFTSPEASSTSSRADSSSYASFSTGATSKHAGGFDSLSGASAGVGSWDSSKSSGLKDASSKSSSHKSFGTSAFFGSEYKDEQQKAYSRFDRKKAPKEKLQRSGLMATWNKLKKNDDTERLLKDD